MPEIFVTPTIPEANGSSVYVNGNDAVILKDKTIDELNQQYGSPQKPISRCPQGFPPVSHTMPDLFSRILKEQKKVLPWLNEGGLVMVSAERGLGKTYFALSLAYAIASGRQRFMKYPITEPMGVWYIDGEMALVEIQKRLRSISGGHATELLTITSHEDFYAYYQHDLAMTYEDIQQGILNFLDQNKFLRLVIIDNLSSLTRIREDKSDDWRLMMVPFLIKCRSRGVAVVLIHHCGKSGDQRGTCAREDQLDTSIRLVRVDEYAEHTGCRFKVIFTKARGCYGDDTQPFVATLVESKAGMDWEIETIVESSKERLLTLVKESGSRGIAVTEAAIALNVSKGFISRLKKDCEKAGIFATTQGKTPMRLVENSSNHKE